MPDLRPSLDSVSGVATVAFFPHHPWPTPPVSGWNNCQGCWVYDRESTFRIERAADFFSGGVMPQGRVVCASLARRDGFGRTGFAAFCRAEQCDESPCAGRSASNVDEASGTGSSSGTAGTFTSAGVGG